MPRRQGVALRLDSSESSLSSCPCARPGADQIPRHTVRAGRTYRSHQRCHNRRTQCRRSCLGRQSLERRTYKWLGCRDCLLSGDPDMGQERKRGGSLQDRQHCGAISMALRLFPVMVWLPIYCFRAWALDLLLFPSDSLARDAAA